MNKIYFAVLFTDYQELNFKRFVDHQNINSKTIILNAI